MISARQLRKSYADETGQLAAVLDGLELDVAAGELVAIVGPSGSGKSTLLHILGGLDVDYAGEVSVAGERLTGLSDKALAAFRNRQVGFVFQSFHLVPTMTALQNVLLPAYFAATSPGPAQLERARALLGRVGLSHKEARAPSQLSGGERQRVAIARALFASPKVLFCDEPTGNLDVVTGREIIRLFEELNREGLTILAVTHEERISDSARRVLRLKDGRLVPDVGGGAR